MRNYKQFTEEEKKAYAEKKNAEIKLAIEEIEEGVKKVFESSDWKNYLEFQSSFHKYSFCNVLWIWFQNQHATQVASFQDWKKRGRYVKKGEKGIKVRIPTQKKVVLTNERGEDEERIKMYFKVGYVFDIAQTEGKEIPQICKLLDNNSLSKELLEKLFPRLEKVTGFTIKYLNDCNSAEGWCDLKDNEIAISTGKSTVDTFATVIHECSHALSKNICGTKLEKCDEEIIAESVAYSVLRFFGLDTKPYSFEYIANWYTAKNGNGKALKEVLEEIKENSNILIDAVSTVM